jgi:arsenic resistance protein ArsH
MKILIFNGSLERRANATSHKITEYLKASLEALEVEVIVFDLADSGIPLFDMALSAWPEVTYTMNSLFRSADHHIWLTPLYHGGMTGVMKNCLDWLELSAKEVNPYLTDKKVGLICWADGSQAMQGINNMDAVAKALRAWTLPFSIPIARSGLFDSSGEFSSEYTKKFEVLTNMLVRTA